MPLNHIGLSLFNFQPQSKHDWQFIGWSLFACFVGRVAQVYPLVILINWFNARSSDKRLGKDQSTHMALDRTENTQEGERDGDIELASPSIDLTDNNNKHNNTLQIHDDRQQEQQQYQQQPVYHQRGAHLSLGYHHMILFTGLRGPIAYAT